MTQGNHAPTPLFLVCGEALWDLFAVEGESGLTFDARIGGSPFNVALGLARMEQRSALFTGLSTDRLGERLLEALEQEGVETGLLARKSKPTTLSVVDIGADGGPRYAFYGDGAADRSVTLQDLPVLGDDIWGVHAGSYSLVAEPIGETLLALVRQEAGRRLVTIDPNVRLNVEPDAALWRKRVGEFVTCADLVKVSDEDLDLLYPGATIADIVRLWRDNGAGLVIVTRGAEGAEAHGAFGRVETPGAAVDVADTVGAGDTFQAALIARLAETNVTAPARLRALGANETTRLLRFAIQASAITCGRRGADLPSRAEIEAKLKGPA